MNSGISESFFSGSDSYEALDRGDDVASPLRLIDCREEDEFAFNRIDGAELIPLSRFAELAPAKLLDGGGDAKQTPLVIYCHHGMRSLQATHFLRQRGLEKVWSLASGIDAWSQQIDPAVPRY